MSTPQKLLFGGLDMLGLHDYVFPPRPGPVEMQALRRQPFGLKGELELRGETGGQTIVVQIRLFDTSHEKIQGKVDKIAKRLTERIDLSLQYNGGLANTKHPIGMVTFDALDQQPIRDIIFSTDSASYRVQCDVVLVFRRLKQGD